MNKLVIKRGKKLTKKEIAEIDETKAREWGNSPMGKHQITISTFFHLRDEKGDMLSLVQLLDIPKFAFNGEEFSLTGIGGMISKIKGKGYGKELLRGVISYLRKKDLTTFGFCDDDVSGFYQKSGFTIVPGLTKKFVFYDKKGNKKVNTKELNVMYCEGSDHFVSKILKVNPQEVVLPRTPDW